MRIRAPIYFGKPASICSSTEITDKALSSIVELSRCSRRCPSAEPRYNSEKWSVSRASNFYLSVFLLSIFLSQAR